MSALSEAKTAGLPVSLETIVSIIGPIIWQWMDAHQGQVAFHVKGSVWKIPYSVSISYDQLRPFVVQLIGADPRGTLPGVPA